MTKPLCIYHNNCADGFGAAWVVWKKFPDWEFFAADYKNPPPDVTGRDVVIVDFSYKRPVMEEIARAASNVLVLDHHKTAQADLETLPLEHLNMSVIFDMGRSGAMITWDYFNPDMDPPVFLRHLMDHDLWRFNLTGTREAYTYIRSFPYDFATWDKIIVGADPLTTEGDVLYRQAIAEGAAIERKFRLDTVELVKATKRHMTIGGVRGVPVANVPHLFASDVGHLLAKGAPFSATYFDQDGARKFSLRSDDHGMDVSEIAKLYGGGGHTHAAGFFVPLGWEGDVL